MFTQLAQRLDARNRNDEGMALLSTIGIMVFVFLTLTAIVFTLQTSIRQTSSAKDSLASRIAAESGSDAALASALSLGCDREGESDDFGYSYALYGNSFELQTPSAPDSYGNQHRCPEDGDLFLLIQSEGTGDRGVTTEITSVYRWQETFDSEASTRSLPTLISRTEK